MTEIAILPGRPEHPVDRIAALMWSAGPALSRYLYGDRAFWTAFLRREWPIEDGWLGHGATRVAMAGPELVGLITTHRPAEFGRRVGEAMARWPAIWGPAAAAGLVARLGVLGELFPATPEDGLYVFELAVAPAWQGRGIGRRLMQAAAREARAAGLTRLHLEVAADKPAVGFYQHLGMHIVSEHHDPELEARHGVGRHFHMVKDLV